MELLNHPDINELIEIAIREDVGDGDHSSLACIPADQQGQAYCIAKESGIIAGIELAKKIFHRIDPHLVYEAHLKDGDEIQIGTRVFDVKGSDISILTAERLVLNFMQRLSGIASQSKKISLILKDYKTTILDTRKTTPGMRLLEKWAVKTGGCSNHRMGLYDMVMLKDNHIDFAGGIKQAIQKTNEYLQNKGLNLDIEIETRSLDEVKEVLEFGGVKRIMLDNFSPELLKEAIQLINGQYETEASGGITLSTIEKYAESGVDFISVGALTHSSKSIDLSMRVLQK
ncbi:MAG: carboxylating nicotinate-nucleotide diphosphorylase [Bacteroidia bacterium]